MIYTYMIPIYTALVRNNRYALSPDNNPKSLPVVPEEYRVPVAKAIADGA